jgi:hypothetical protein
LLSNKDTRCSLVNSNNIKPPEDVGVKRKEEESPIHRQFFVGFVFCFSFLVWSFEAAALWTVGRKKTSETGTAAEGRLQTPTTFWFALQSV